MAGFVQYFDNVEEKENSSKLVWADLTLHDIVQGHFFLMGYLVCRGTFPQLGGKGAE